MVLETRGITKSFGSMYALLNVSFGIQAGKFHALVGENGAGKSTLIKILSGIYAADAGEIIWQGKPVTISNPRQSRDLGVTVIHQDRHLIPSFTVVENVFLGLEYEKQGIRIHWEKMRERVSRLMDELSIHIPLDIPAHLLSPPQRTQTEILRAMMTDCRLLILDEPTAALTDQEAAQLFASITRLREQGTAILYVSHRLDEIIALSDSITVLRNGQLVQTLKRGTGKDELIALMSESAVKRKTEVRPITAAASSDHKLNSAGSPSPGEYLLEVEGISSTNGILKNISLKARAGEILGIFGLGGSGRTESLECIYGSLAKAGGTLLLRGAAYPHPSPRRSIQRGMAMIFEDRRGKALVTSLSVRENTVLSKLDSYCRFGIVSRRAQERDVAAKIKELSIKTTGSGQPVIELSGGNQQKVAFAKALITSPMVILCDEPTQAVDVKTRHEIHALLRAMASQGKAVVFVSSDVQEMLELAHRVQIIAGGQSRECFENDSLTAEQILKCCYAG